MKNNMHQTNTNLVSLERSLLSVLTSQMAVVTHVHKQSPGGVLKKSCSEKFRKISKNIFFYRTPLVAAFACATKTVFYKNR